jgi:hypothetical protein
MPWQYTPDFELRVQIACPKCKSLDLYTSFADFTRLRLSCNQCNHCFNGKQGCPNPEVAKIVDAIRALVNEANQKGGLHDGK